MTPVHVHDPLWWDVQVWLTQKAFDGEPLPLLTSQIACQLDGTAPNPAKGLNVGRANRQFEFTALEPGEIVWFILGESLPPNGGGVTQTNPVRSSNPIDVLHREPTPPAMLGSPTARAIGRALRKRPSENHCVDPVVTHDVWLEGTVERPEALTQRTFCRWITTQGGVGFLGANLPVIPVNLMLADL